MTQQYMVYEDYRKSALKHLKTCEYMIDNLYTITENDTLDNLTKEERKNHILRDIYYLLGFVIEGVVNYCIYKSLNYNNANDVENLAIHNLRRHFNNQYFRQNDIGVCFNYHRQGNRDGQGNIIGFYYSISNHNYAKNIEILKTRFSTLFGRINIINRSRTANNKLSEMFYDWKVEMRYHTDNTNATTSLTYNEEDIVDFFIFVHDKIYTQLPRFFSQRTR